jgi:hypothetical protein
MWWAVCFLKWRRMRSGKEVMAESQNDDMQMDAPPPPCSFYNLQ